MLTLKDTVSLKDLATRYGVSINGLSRALKRAGHDKPIVRRSKAVPEPGAAKAKGKGKKKAKGKARKARKGPDPRSAEAKEWWDDFLARKDKEPLASLARRYGVAEITLQRAMKRTGTERKSQRGARGAKSARSAARKLSPFKDQLGRITDAEVAALAGISKYQVTQYRKRKGIPSSRAAVPVQAPVAAPAKVRKASAAPRRSAASVAQEAYLVNVDAAGATSRYVVIGRDLAEAAGRAQEAVQARYAKAADYTIVGLEFIGPAL